MTDDLTWHQKRGRERALGLHRFTGRGGFDECIRCGLEVPWVCDTVIHADDHGDDPYGRCRINADGQHTDACTDRAEYDIHCPGPEQDEDPFPADWDARGWAHDDRDRQGDTMLTDTTPLRNPVQVAEFTNELLDELKHAGSLDGDNAYPDERFEVHAQGSGQRTSGYGPNTGRITYTISVRSARELLAHLLGDEPRDRLSAHLRTTVATTRVEHLRITHTNEED